MSESESRSSNPSDQLLPRDQQLPPVLSEPETSAVLQARAAIDNSRGTIEGQRPYEEYVMGITYDGTLVSVDEQKGVIEDHFVVRVAPVSDLADGQTLAEQKVPYGSWGCPGAIRVRDGGSTLISSDLGHIRVEKPRLGMLPVFDGKVIFPIGEDGQPHDPYNEQSPAKSPDTVGTGGLRRFLRKRRR